MAFSERNTCQDGTDFVAHMSTHMSQSTLSLVFGIARSLAAAQPNSNKGNRVDVTPNLHIVLGSTKVVAMPSAKHLAVAQRIAVLL